MAGELDTSGFVWLQHGQLANTYWEDLDPFTQGYVEALFEALRYHPSTPLPQPPSLGWRNFAFSDLSPEALALILEDCARYKARGEPSPVMTALQKLELGKALWRDRNANCLANWFYIQFPPLRPFLSDDGKIHLRQADGGGA